MNGGSRKYTQLLQERVSNESVEYLQPLQIVQAAESVFGNELEAVVLQETGNTAGEKKAEPFCKSNT